MKWAQGHAHRSRWLGLLTVVMLLGACGRAHVVRQPAHEGLRARVEATPSPRRASTGEVEVARGDTLYGIAFRNGLDFRDLAVLNDIQAPYTIYVGQILKLRGERRRPVVPPAAKVAQAPARQPPPPVAAHQVQTESTTAAVGDRGSAPTTFEPVAAPAAGGDSASSRGPAPTPVQAPAQPPQQLVAPVVVPPVARADDIAPRTPSAAILPAEVAKSGGIHWRWPASGSLLDRFMPGDATRQGIDIAGHAGDPVVAASDGVVVYSGSGLVGYGELIIIKHSDEWLSAYGHNRKRLVSEGQRVKAGQPIAEMGNSGAPRDELHFEIRRNGRPVDPQQYLPLK